MTLVYVRSFLSSCRTMYWKGIYRCKPLSTIFTGSVRRISVCLGGADLSWGAEECRPVGCSKLLPSYHRLSVEMTLIQRRRKESWPVVMCWCGQCFAWLENSHVIPSAWKNSCFNILFVARVHMVFTIHSVPGRVAASWLITASRSAARNTGRSIGRSARQRVGRWDTRTAPGALLGAVPDAVRGVLLAT